MAVHHPALLKFTCAECKKYVYNMETGERFTVCNGLLDMQRPVGPSGEPEPPCNKCPKGSPDREREFILTPANYKTLKLYLEVRVTFGQGLTDAMKNDRWLMNNFRLIDGIVRDHERHEQQKFLSELVAGTRKL